MTIQEGGRVLIGDDDARTPVYGARLEEDHPVQSATCGTDVLEPRVVGPLEPRVDRHLEPRVVGPLEPRVDRTLDSRRVEEALRTADRPGESVRTERSQVGDAFGFDDVRDPCRDLPGVDDD